MRILKFAALFFLCTASPAFASPLVNPGFEMGDLTGWNGDGATVVTSYTAQNGSVYGPAFGNYFALLYGADSAAPTTLFGLTQSDFNPYSPPGYAGYYGGAGVAQTVSLSAGEQLTFSYLFYADDYEPFTDSAFFVVNNSITLLASIESVGGQNGTTGWTPFSWTAPSADTYNLGFIVLNGGDNAYASHLAIDAPSVPELGSTLLLGTALIGLVGAMRRRLWS